PFFIGFGHQGAFAVDVVGGAACCALRDSLGNFSAKGVVAVLDSEVFCAVLDCCSASFFSQPAPASLMRLPCVMAVLLLPPTLPLSFSQFNLDH
ncbi:hypothetical protein, partial [Ottowia cancrivicina]